MQVMILFGGEKLRDIKAIAEVVEDYSLVSFTTLDIQDKKSVYNVLKLVDKSNNQQTTLLVKG